MFFYKIYKCIIFISIYYWFVENMEYGIWNMEYGIWNME